ncbi:unnamed protein product [Vitrella brassicaformis CCMP3155]|uniref:EGF-like domain-containing protein n=2 Tax=Vitrella brassicaformis TaxID=1169539 RepID=A0A0G4H690_VITBC|nr:unnamed protein product [Vitrella brassicaformis CCMP3155]|eukprot:CEM39221.1 unnamed protein product [Vitrella brassicaformis CCMP3155]
MHVDVCPVTMIAFIAFDLLLLASHILLPADGSEIKWTEYEELNSCSVRYFQLQLHGGYAVNEVILEISDSTLDEGNTPLFVLRKNALATRSINDLSFPLLLTAHTDPFRLTVPFNYSSAVWYATLYATPLAGSGRPIFFCDGAALTVRLGQRVSSPRIYVSPLFHAVQMRLYSNGLSPLVSFPLPESLWMPLDDDSEDDSSTAVTRFVTEAKLEVAWLSLPDVAKDVCVRLAYEDQGFVNETDSSGVFDSCEAGHCRGARGCLPAPVRNATEDIRIERRLIRLKRPVPIWENVTVLAESTAVLSYPRAGYWSVRFARRGPSVSTNTSDLLLVMAGASVCPNATQPPGPSPIPMPARRQLSPSQSLLLGERQLLPHVDENDDDGDAAAPECAANVSLFHSHYWYGFPDPMAIDIPLNGTTVYAVLPVRPHETMVEALMTLNVSVRTTNTTSLPAAAAAEVLIAMRRDGVPPMSNVTHCADFVRRIPLAVDKHDGSGGKGEWQAAGGAAVGPTRDMRPGVMVMAMQLVSAGEGRLLHDLGAVAAIRVEASMEVVRECPDDCSHHGSCDNTVVFDFPLYSCSCQYGYHGEACELQYLSQPFSALGVVCLVGSNIAVVPVVMLTWRKGWFFKCLLFANVGIWSAVYHACDVEWLCLFNYPQLQSLDFTCAFLSFVVVILEFCHFSHPIQRSFLMSLFALTVTLTSKSATASANILVVFSLLILVYLSRWLFWLAKGRFMPRLLPAPMDERGIAAAAESGRPLMDSPAPSNWLILRQTVIDKIGWSKNVGLGLLSAGFGIVCFFCETSANYWLLHSLWHVFIQLSPYMLLKAAARARKTMLRRRRHTDARRTRTTTDEEDSEEAEDDDDEPARDSDDDMTPSMVALGPATGGRRQPKDDKTTHGQQLPPLSQPATIVTDITNVARQVSTRLMGGVNGHRREREATSSTELTPTNSGRAEGSSVSATGFDSHVSAPRMAESEREQDREMADGAQRQQGDRVC